MTYTHSLCIVADEPGWAFDRTARSLTKQLRRFGVDVQLCYRNTLPQVINQDFVLVFWWRDVDLVRTRVSSEQRIVCRIADMITWNYNAPKDWRTAFLNILGHVHLFVTSSEEIQNRLLEMGITNCIIIGNGVDVEEFRLKTYHSVEQPVVGWCGNPTALAWLGFYDVKGISVLGSLQYMNGLTVKMCTDIPLEEMPEWYRSVDVYVCASRSEGTPLPVLEAMAVGNIVISTAVGVIPKLDSRGIFLFDGTCQGLRSTLREVLKVRYQWPSLGEENRKCILRGRKVEHMGLQVHRILLYAKMTRSLWSVQNEL